MIVRLDGKRTITPMLLVIVAIGTTDLLFALIRSRPSSADEGGLHRLCGERLSLMGLRQLYFLLVGCWSDWCIYTEASRSCWD